MPKSLEIGVSAADNRPQQKPKISSVQHINLLVWGEMLILMFLMKTYMMLIRLMYARLILPGEAADVITLDLPSLLDSKESNHLLPLAQVHRGDQDISLST